MRRPQSSLWSILPLTCLLQVTALGAEAEDLHERNADLVAALKSSPQSAIRHLRQQYPKDPEANRMIGLLENIGHPFDYSGTAFDGRLARPADFRGKVVLIEVCFRHCGGCIAELPRLRRLIEKYEQQGLAVVYLSLDRSLVDAKEMVTRFNLREPVLCDTRGAEGDLARRLFVSYAPRGILFDRQGNLRVLDCLRGGRSLETLLPQLLAEE